MSVLSGSFKDCTTYSQGDTFIARVKAMDWSVYSICTCVYYTCNTVSQCPWVISDTKPSILSTVFRVMDVSSYAVEGRGRDIHSFFCSLNWGLVKHACLNKGCQTIHILYVHSCISTNGRCALNRTLTCKVASVRTRLFSFKYCSISLTTLRDGRREVKGGGERKRTGTLTLQTLFPAPSPSRPSV